MAPTEPAASVPNTRWIVERWTLTTTNLGALGLDACPSVGSPQVGASQSLLLTTERSDEVLFAVVVNPANPTDRMRYDGTIDGDAFTATTGDGSGVMTCGATRVQFHDVQRVTGRFSDGGRSLVGEEVYSIWLASGATLTWHSEWRATRQ